MYLSIWHTEVRDGIKRLKVDIHKRLYGIVENGFIVYLDDPFFLEKVTSTDTYDIFGFIYTDTSSIKYQYIPAHIPNTLNNNKKYIANNFIITPHLLESIEFVYFKFFKSEWIDQDIDLKCLIRHYTPLMKDLHPEKFI